MQPSLDRIILALQDQRPEVRQKGINALVRNAEASTDDIVETLMDLAVDDTDAEVKALANKRLEQYRQYIKKKTGEQAAIEPAKPTAPTDNQPRMGKNTFVMHHRNLPYLFGDVQKPPIKTAWGELFGFLLTFIGGLLVLSSLGTRAKAVFDYNLISDEATIVDSYFAPQQAGWEAVYEYLAPDGSLKRGTYAYTDATIAYDLSIGDTVKIEYTGNSAKMLPPRKLSIFMTGGLISGIVAVVGASFALIYTADKMGKYMTLAKEGQLLDGVIAAASIEKVKSKRGGFVASIMNRLFPRYMLIVEYQFQSPETKKLVSGTEKEQRNDLKDKRPPRLGVGVQVLYQNDKTHMIL